jgi:flagellar protein FliO/FliZ
VSARYVGCFIVINILIAGVLSFASATTTIKRADIRPAPTATTTIERADTKPAPATEAIGENEFNYQDPGTAPKTGNFFFSLVRIILSLGLVAGLVLIAAHFLKKYGKLTPSAGQEQEFVNVLSRTGIAAGKSIYIVEILGKIIVLGVTDSSINVLFESNDAAFIQSLKERKPAQAQEPLPFLAHLKQFSERFK